MMKLPALRRGTRGTASLMVEPLPAPVGGINTRDSESRMADTDAVAMENWWPDTTDLAMRKGAAYHLTGIASAVKSLMAYQGLTSGKLFAATSTNIYDASVAGAVGASVKTITNGVFIHTMMTVAGGTYLVAVNGTDKLLQYNGTTWDFIDDLTTPAITGLATTSLVYVALFKRRLWFVEKNSMNAWYLPVDVVGGALTKFPIGELFTKGGKLLAIGTWSIDGGVGQDDHLVFITTEGECAVYKGIDPADDLAHVGTYFVTRPVGRKCFIKYGGDLHIITVSGLIPMSRILQGVIPNRNAYVSEKINKLLTRYAVSYDNREGWSGTVIGTENMLLLNVPTTEFSAARQVCMNTITNAWTEFTGWNATCWELWGTDLYFGGTTYVAKALTGLNDFDANIVCTVKQAPNYFRSRTTKQWELIRPLLRVSGNITLGVGLDVDFEERSDYASISVAGLGTALWDTGTWDTSLWGSDAVLKKEWRTVFANPGFSAALRLRVAAKDVTVTWSSTDFAFKPTGKGGIL